MTRSNSCCPNNEVQNVRDFSVNLGNANGFMERAGIIPVRRNPRPVFVPGQLLAHSLPLRQPFPNPDNVLVRNGDPAPDRGDAQSWPFTEEELG